MTKIVLYILRYLCYISWLKNINSYEKDNVNISFNCYTLF